MSMSDEESFVILGSTPTPSMNSHFEQIEASRSVIRSPTNAAIMQVSQPFSMLDITNGASIGPASNGTGSNSLTNGTNGTADSVQQSNASIRSMASEAPSQVNKLQSGSVTNFPGVNNGSFAADEPRLSMLQSSIVDYFPSLCTPASAPEDLQKLGSLVCEHLELKENLEKTNIAMRQHFGMIQKWQENVQTFKAAKQREAFARVEEIAKLKDEVLALNKELIDKSKHFELTRNLMQQENTDLVQQVSHQKSIILNMSDQINRFEKEAHSFEMLSMASTKPVASIEVPVVVPDVQRLEALVVDLKHQLSQLASTNETNESMMKSMTQLQAESQATIAGLNEQLANSLKNVESEKKVQQLAIESLNQQLEEVVAKNAELEKSKNVVEKIVCPEDRQNTIQKLNAQLKELAAKNRELDESNNSFSMLHEESMAQLNSMNTNQTIVKLNEQLKEMAVKNRQLEDVHNVVVEQANRVEELQNVLSTTNSQLSSVLAENLETLDMKQIYVDQINCLEANIAEINGLLQTANAEIAALHAAKSESAQQLATKDDTIQSMQSQVDVLGAQLEIYRNDFETERKSRQDMASEREEILSDLKLLQRRNEELMKAANMRPTVTPSNAPSTSAPPADDDDEEVQLHYVCPVCNRKYMDYKRLESHVNDCLLNVT